VIDQIDEIIKSSLTTLAEDIASGWTGRREREVVSLFCFGHLLRHCRPGSFLLDPTQIAIEVAIPQIPGQTALTGKVGSKKQVCKDIVIWPKARMTCWDDTGKPTVKPASVIEWKHNEDAISDYDVQWLCEFSAQVPNFVGYAISSNQPARGYKLSCTRVFHGEAEAKWLYLV